MSSNNNLDKTISEQNIKPIFYENIERETIKNKFYRKVVYTGKMQFVYMSIKPKDDIHMEVHDDHDQFFRIESGEGEALINNQKYKLSDGIGFIVPAGAEHKITNTSKNQDLKLYSIYSPPEHPPNRLDINNPDKLNNVLTQSSGNYYSKYLKYKNKYLETKK